MIATGFLGVLAGTILWLDRVYLFQLMLSRPIIMGPIIAFIMGDVKIGLLVGASMELLWLYAPPVGSYLPNDESFCTAAAVPVAFMAGSSIDHTAAAGLSILLCLPVSLAGRSLDMRIRTLNEGLIPIGGEVLERDIKSSLRKAVVRAFVLAFLVLSACVIVIGMLASLIKPLFNGAVLNALSYMPFFCVVIGLAAIVSKEMPRKIHTGMFVLGMAIVLLLTWIL
ncbi:MAG TPA: PTS sugar transporter subunit IIC [Desulfomonilia bacterium]|nr:PTS sugar transporter subunit IIC [Desulfomonilia bacterium]